MSDKPTDYGREVRDTIVKSSLTGVAATVLAVTIFSPAGFGGMIGNSLASGFGLGTNASSSPDDNPYANLPAYPAPLSQEELTEIRGQLARTAASLEITRAATEARIDHIRNIALAEGVVTFAPMAYEPAPLRLTMSEPAPAPVTAAEPVQVAEPAPAAEPVEQAAAVPVNYSVADANRDSHLELADLMLAYVDQ